MNRLRCLPLVALLLLLLGSSAAAAADAAPASEIARLLRRQCEGSPLGDEVLRAGRALGRFYRQRDFQPAWNDGLRLGPAADELIDTLPAADAEGLDPRNYHHHALSERRSRFRSAPTPQLAAELDLLLTDAFMLLGSHYLGGRINPVTFDNDWHVRGEEGDPVRMLNQALASGRIRDSLNALLPSAPAYGALRRAYQDYRQLAAVGGWPKLQFKPPLRPGDAGAAVTALRRRLVVGGDLAAADGNGELFDSVLDTAVRRFQYRHGLGVDGVVGRATLAALNVPAAQRVRQLAVNLERWRWLPRHFGERYVLVNIPAFALELVEAGRTVLAMRVIVGRPVRNTPVFTGRMAHLVLNPYWEVPHHLAVADLLPKIQADPRYLAKNGFSVFREGGTRELDPDNIDWQQLGRGNFPYHLRQNPGPKNALGRIKFIFPNPYNVYLHDTPSRELFSRELRSFSSGCIRIEKPFELAELLLRGTPLATRIVEIATQGKENQIVPLPETVPVHLLYWTAWVDAYEMLHFRPDLYRRDPRLDAALRQPPPRTGGAAWCGALR